MNKTLIDFQSSIDKALQRYVVDRENQLFSQEESLGLVNLKKALPVEKLLPKIFPEGILSSIAMVEYLREAKLRINIIGSQALTLENEIRSATANLWGTLNDVTMQVKQLEADIQEEEIKAQDKYQLVHYNAFVRPVDMSAKQLKLTPLDWKTEQPFPLGYELKLIPSAGLTLPHKAEHQIFIRSVSVLDESTDVGDTLLPLIKTDPMDILKSGSSFRYVIARRVYDSTGRLYNYTESTCKLLVELGTVQLVNHVALTIAASSPLFLKQLEYINESGELITANIDVLPVDGKLDILVEPIRAKFLLFTLVQYVPVEETTVTNTSLQRTELNKLLIGAGWSVLLEDDSTELNAKIYDFSVSDLQVRFIAYKHLGYFLSQYISLNKPLSINLVVATEAIRITSEQHSYNSNYFLPDDTVLFETYLKLILVDRINNKQLDISFPVPTSKQGAQVELLPLTGSTAKASFFPDMFYNAFRGRVSSVTFALRQASVTLQAPHGIPQDIVFTDPIELWLDRNKGTKNLVSVSWYAVSDVKLILEVDYIFSSLGSISENETPQGWIIRRASSIPFEVYQEEVLLSLGIDYQYSLDNGINWFSELITYAEYAELKEAVIAGNFKIKILSPDSSVFYWISYRRMNKQYLHPSKLLLLRGTSVFFAKKLRKFKGTVQTLLVLRSNSKTPYLTSVVQNYKLKVREL